SQVKTGATDGYDAVQLGFEAVKPRRSTIPVIGHDAKAGLAAQRYHREFRTGSDDAFEVGQAVTVENFADVKFVDVVGTSKGKGTQGVMKRHNFGGQPASHGTERKHRSPGAISSRATNRGHSGKLKKGIRMAGRMGNEQVTTRNHPVVGIDADKNLLLIKGALPGPNGGLLFVRKAITAKVRSEE